MLGRSPLRKSLMKAQVGMGMKRPSPEVVFECTRLKGSDKKGIIRPDEQGAYSMVIGGLNAYNARDDFYDYESGKKFFESSSIFQRRIAKGALKAEYGHPKLEPGMSIEQFGARIANIEESKVCGTWVKIWLSSEKGTDHKGRPFIPIMGSIRPSGPYGQVLKEAFEQPGENVCFSIRSITNDTLNRLGTRNKHLHEIITFDYVNEPGISSAEKLLSPTLESYEEVRVHPEKMLKYLNQSPLPASVESFDMKELMKEMIEDQIRSTAWSQSSGFHLW